MRYKNKASSTPVPNHHVRNPFHDRINFPSFDKAFETKSISNFSISASGTSNTLYGEDQDVDISIDARAALNAHRRHVAKYGIDGDENNSLSAFENDYILEQDLVWNKLLETQSQISDNNSRLETTVVNDYEDDDGEGVIEAIEVSLLSTSSHNHSDYFESSKVWLLATPEKAKNCSPRNFLTSRQNIESDETPCIDAESSCNTNDEDYFVHAVSKMNLYEAELNDSTQNSDSFAVDVSHISAVDSERTPLRGSPGRNWNTTIFPENLDTSFGSFLSPLSTVMGAGSESHNLAQNHGGNRDKLSLNKGMLPIFPDEANPRFSSTPSAVKLPWKRHPRNSPQISESLHTHIDMKCRGASNNETFFNERNETDKLLSPIEARAAQLARRIGLWKERPNPFPENDNFSEEDKFLETSFTQSESQGPGKDCFSPSIVKVFPDDCSSVSSCVTSSFLETSFHTKSINDAPQHVGRNKLRGKQSPVRSKDSEISFESFEGSSSPSPISEKFDFNFNRQPLDSPTDDNHLPRGSKSIQIESSNQNHPSAVSEDKIKPLVSVGKPFATNELKQDCPMREMTTDRRRYRTVVPTRVLFEDFDGYEYGSFHSAPNPIDFDYPSERHPPSRHSAS